MQRTKYLYDSDGKFNKSDDEILVTMNEIDKMLIPLIDKMYNKISKEQYDRVQLENFVKSRIDSNLMIRLIDKRIK